MNVNHNYVDFITDSQLFNIIGSVIKRIDDDYKNYNWKQFTKNKIDVFDLAFSTQLEHEDISNWIKNELNRKIDKTLTGRIGFFQETILGQSPLLNHISVGKSKHSIDLENTSKGIYVDVKNKYNTVNAGSKRSVFYNLLNAVKTSTNPQSARGYMATITAKHSFNDPLVAYTSSKKANKKKKKLIDPRIRVISGDQFYQLAFPNSNNPFKQLVRALPKAIKDYMSQHKNELLDSSTILNKLLNDPNYKKILSNKSLSYNDICDYNFKCYKGWN